MTFKTKYLLISTLIIVGMLLTSCGAAASATPTIDPNTVITEVARTVQAGFQLTQAALPTATTTMTALPTSTQTPTLNVTSTPFIVNISTTLPQLPGSVNSPDRLHFSWDVTVPDGTTFKPSENFTKTWWIANIGTTTWTTSYKFAYCAGLPVNVVDKLIPKMIFNIPEEVVPWSSQPAKFLEISVDMFAPEANGHYKVYFQLLTDKGKQIPDDFGNPCGIWVDFYVNDGTNPMPTP
jgi:hypothetical protein